MKWSYKNVRLPYRWSLIKPSKSFSSLALMFDLARQCCLWKYGKVRARFSIIFHLDKIVLQAFERMNNDCAGANAFPVKCKFQTQNLLAQCWMAGPIMIPKELIFKEEAAAAGKKVSKWIIFTRAFSSLSEFCYFFGAQWSPPSGRESDENEAWMGNKIKIYKNRKLNEKFLLKY